MKHKIFLSLLLSAGLMDCSQRTSRIHSNSSTPRTKCALTNMSTPTTVPDYSFQRTTPPIDLPLGREYWFGTAQQPDLRAAHTPRARPTSTAGSLQRNRAIQQPLVAPAPVIQPRRGTSFISHRTPSISNNSRQQALRVTSPSQQPGQPESPSYADMVRRNNLRNRQ